MKWINVSDRLPEKHDNYLVLVYGSGASWNDIVFFDVDRGWSDFDLMITHWMPIPKLPEEDD